MKSSSANLGRTFVIRLEDGDILHESIEKFAAEKGIKAASLIVLGGADKGSTIVVGPKEGRAEKVEPMDHILDETYEITGTGTIFPNAEGKPVLHMHIAAGRGDQTITGCARKGVKVWHVMEVILTELTDTTASRKLHPPTGFELLEP